MKKRKINAEVRCFLYVSGSFSVAAVRIKHYFAVAINDKHLNEYLRLIQSCRTYKLLPDKNRTILDSQPLAVFSSHSYTNV